MRHRIVQFAGRPDPLIRREALKMCALTPPGARQSRILNGYLISVTGQEERAIARCIELLPDAVLLSGNFFILDAFTTDEARVLIPSATRLWSGTDPLGGDGNDDTVPGRTTFPTSAWGYAAGYHDRTSAGGIFSRPFGYSLNPDAPEGHCAIAHVVENGVCHAVYRPSSSIGLGGDGGYGAGMTNVASTFFSEARFVWGRLDVRYLAMREQRGVSLTDAWVTWLLGSPHYFIGRGLTGRVRIPREQSPSSPEVLEQLPWRSLGPTPAPRYVSDPDDGGVVVPPLINAPNPWPHQMLREHHGAPVQPCYPAVYPTTDLIPQDELAEGQEVGATRPGLLLAVPCMASDESHHLLYLQYENRVPEDVYSEGWISSWSIAYLDGLGNIAAPCMSPAAGDPKLVLLKFTGRPLTEEDRNRSTYTEAANIQLGTYRLSYRTNGANVFSPLSEENLPPVDHPVMSYEHHSVVTIHDLPEFIRPMRLRDWRDMFTTAMISQGRSTPEEARHRITSDNWMPHVFGAVYQTVAGEGDERFIEYVFQARTRAGCLVPVTRERRAAPEDILPGEQIPLMATKVGLAVVRATLDGQWFDTDLWFPDVIGPADCPFYSASDMDESVAKMPQVKFAGVFNGQRVYCCRVVRYARTPFLASLFGAEGATVHPGHTAGFDPSLRQIAGYGPSFFTDRGFGPYPDQAQYEELWVIVDGERRIIDTTALGGFLEPVTNAKWSETLRFKTIDTLYTRLYYSYMLNMWTEEQEQDRTLLEYMVEDFAPTHCELATFCQISDNAFLFILFPTRYSTTDALRYKICRYDMDTGDCYVIYEGVGEWPGFPPRATWFAPALTCYQREVLDENGDVRTPAHLMLRVGFGTATSLVPANRSGIVSTSVDGGLTWSFLFSDSYVRGAGQYGALRGTPGLGVYILGTMGKYDTKFQYLIDEPDPSDGE